MDLVSIFESQSMGKFDDEVKGSSVHIHGKCHDNSSSNAFVLRGDYCVRVQILLDFVFISDYLPCGLFIQECT